MTLQTFDVGDTVRLTATYTDTGGSPIDPSSVKIILRDPTGTESTRTSGSTGITNTVTGTFYSDFALSLSGAFRWRSYSTGSLLTAAESEFVVRKQWVSTG